MPKAAAALERARAERDSQDKRHLSRIDQPGHKACPGSGLSLMLAVHSEEDDGTVVDLPWHQVELADQRRPAEYGF